VQGFPVAERLRWREQIQVPLLAVQFLTRVPVPVERFGPITDIKRLLTIAVIFFPIVGLGIGLFTSVVIYASLQVWPPLVAILLGLTAEAILTGAFHEDAVADFCDAFGGGWSREDILRILKDSRVGSFGALGLFLAVSLRAALLQTLVLALPMFDFCCVLLLSAGLGRWGILLLMTAVGPVPERESTARDIAARLPGRFVLWGSLVPLAAAFVYQPRFGFVAVMVITAGAWLFACYLRWRLGGLTGDCLGFFCYVGQLIALLIAAGFA
jgi:adenosylcobinamide-GDP ribazoletransferase